MDQSRRFKPSHLSALWGRGTLNQSEYEARLRRRITPEFMSTLREAVLFLGNSVDAVEAVNFYNELWRIFDHGEPIQWPPEWAEKDPDF